MRFSKKNMKSLLQDSNKRSLVMPLLGSHPRNGVNADDVMEEIISLLVYCASIETELKEIVIFMRSNTLQILNRLLNNQELGNKRKKMEEEEEEEEEKDNWKKLMPENLSNNIKTLLKQMEKLDNIDSRIKESIGMIITQWKLCKDHLEDANIKTNLLMVLCMQCRRVLERFCRIITGDNRINAGFKEVMQLMNAGVLKQETAELANKLVRNGNKAAHTDIEGGAVTEADANVSILCVIRLLSELKINTSSNASNFGRPLAETDMARLQGDWQCDKCFNTNFARRMQCNACSAPRKIDDTNTNTNTSNTSNTNTTTGSTFVGDWICSLCKTNNFAYRTNCFSCQAPKGVGNNTSTSTTTGTTNTTNNAVWQCANCESVTPIAENMCQGCGGPRLQVQRNTLQLKKENVGQPVVNTSLLRHGDWICRHCNDINFAKRLSCRKCNLPKQ